MPQQSSFRGGAGLAQEEAGSTWLLPGGTPAGQAQPTLGPCLSSPRLAPACGSGPDASPADGCNDKHMSTNRYGHCL